MKLFLSGLQRARDVQTLEDVLSWYGNVPAGLAGVLLSPLLTSASVLDQAHALCAAHGLSIIFDSGGYAVQTGHLGYDVMAKRLMGCYRAHQWADWYVLPDDPPTGADSDDVVWGKVRRTVHGSLGFLHRMPPTMRARAIPVIHGFTGAQLRYALERYAAVQARAFGFGSFPTRRASSLLTPGAHATVQHLGGFVHGLGAALHIFGIGSPAALLRLADAGVDTCDSSTWAASAGYGKVYAPMSIAMPISERHPRAMGALARFHDQCRRAGHFCPWCDDLGLLATSRAHRAAHNLVATLDTLRSTVAVSVPA